ncbi:MAG: YkvA family protein [Deltaproteobacteria bacterium]|nr:YkvA family protein [Deltaproteobacteria bacterium]
MTAFYSSRKTPISLWATVASSTRLLFRADTPWTVKGILALAILYLLSPFDLVPDWIVGLGLLDDLVIVSLLVGWAIRLAGRLPNISSEKQK